MRPEPVPWDPELQSEVRLEEVSAIWTPVGEASVETDVEDVCGEAPCVRVSGPGGASTSAALNRGETYTASATVTASAAATFAVRLRTSSGASRMLVERSLAAGVSSVSEVFSFTEPGTEVSVSIESDEADAVLVIDDFALTGTRWAAAEDEGQGLVRLGFLIHVEEDVNFLTDESAWRRRARVLEGLSGVLADHDAKLGMQLDASFVRGSAEWDPDWIADREAEGAGWSLHIHDETGGAEGIEQAVRDGRVAHREAGAGEVTDLNGGFLTAPWLALRLAGVASLSAYKDPTTQRGLPRVQVQPWRPGDGTGAADPEAFMVHDPEGPLLYLPGHDVREVEHARFPENAAQVLSQVLSQARDGWINTWYFVLHVDGFGPVDDDAAMEAYLSDGSFEEDLAAYDGFLEEVTGPLVAAGRLRYDTPSGMSSAWTDWMAKCEG